jgi:hypothetical protein
MSPEEVLELTNGQEVVHSLFGQGMVVEVKNYAGYGSVVIHFWVHGLKELDTEFAANKLELLWP